MRVCRCGRLPPLAHLADRAPSRPCSGPSGTQTLTPHGRKRPVRNALEHDFLLSAKLAGTVHSLSAIRRVTRASSRERSTSTASFWASRSPRTIATRSRLRGFASEPSTPDHAPVVTIPGGAVLPALCRQPGIHDVIKITTLRHSPPTPEPRPLVDPPDLETTP